MDKELEKQLCETTDLMFKTMRHAVICNLVYAEKEKGNITQDQWDVFVEVAAEKVKPINKAWQNKYLAMNHHDNPSLIKSLTKIQHDKYSHIKHYRFLK